MDVRSTLARTATLLKDITPGPASSSVSNVECKTSTAGESRLFFTEGTQGGSGTRWLSDGTSEGTRPIDDVQKSEL